MRMKSEDVRYGWCYHCGQTYWPAIDSKEFNCERCGNPLTPREKLPRVIRKVLDFQKWGDALSLNGLSGPSPGGAAGELGCHRTMIDKLADMGVLERSVYKKDGHYHVEISVRSIQRALENKRTTGKWTGSGELKKKGLWSTLQKNFSL
jgi:hypothetical protein